MTLPLIPLFGEAEVTPLMGGGLREAMLADIERANQRLWMSMFLVSLAPNDPRSSVRYILDALVRAEHRRVDVRILMDNFSMGPEEYRPNMVAAGYLADRGVSVRVYIHPRRRVSHSKFLIVDERAIIVGSANLTPGGVDNNSELALRVRSPQMARELARRFQAGWDEAILYEKSDETK